MKHEKNLMKEKELQNLMELIVMKKNKKVKKKKVSRCRQ